MNIDRKYKIHAVNPCSRNTHDEYDSILFLAKDRAIPAMLRAYLKESEALGANPAHLESIGLLIGRVEQYQREVEAKVPDTDLPCEIRRCVDGEGVSDNKQDFASGAQPAPSVPTVFVWPERPKRRQSHVLFDDGYEEGWAACVATIKAFLAATPEAKP